jgi:hypothetical protein
VTSGTEYLIGAAVVLAVIVLGIAVMVAAVTAPG